MVKTPYIDRPPGFEIGKIIPLKIGNDICLGGQTGRQQKYPEKALVNEWIPQYHVGGISKENFSNKVLQPYDKVIGFKPRQGRPPITK